MSWHPIYTLAGLLLIVHIILGFSSTLETVKDPRFSVSRKSLWLAVIWLVPVIGAIWVHKQLGLSWGTGAVSGRDITGGAGGQESSDDSSNGGHSE